MTSSEKNDRVETQTYPSLSLERLVLLSQGHIVYNQKFHAGLNILRSNNNSTGKSTLCEFIFHLLGGSVEKWTDASKRCDHIIGQFNVRSATITLRREIPCDVNVHAGIDVFYGNIEEATATMTGWLRYPWRRSQSTESFSQFLFSILGLPESKADQDSNITMHEMLRILYMDQETSPSQIFRYQGFDKGEIRQTIGEVMLGYDDLNLHFKRQELRDLEMAKAKQLSTLGAIQSIINSAFPNQRLQDFEKHEIETQSLIVATGLLLKETDDTLKVQNTPNVSQINSIGATGEKISDEHAKISLKISNVQAILYALKADIEDSKQFVSGLTRKKEAIQSSLSTIDILGGLQFGRCPACLEPIADTNNLGSCYLCKSTLNTGDISTKRMRLLNEVSNQIRESSALVTEKLMALEKTRMELETLKIKKIALMNRYVSLNASANPLRQRQRDLLTKIGYLEKTLEDIREKKRLAQQLESIIDGISVIDKKLNVAQEVIRTHTFNRQARKQHVEQLISNITLDILRRDIRTDNVKDTLANSETFEFDFFRNRLILNGEISSRLSASTTAFMKSAFFLSMFLASLDERSIRLPRFMILDNIEDKGIIPDRIHNFHKIIIDELAKRKYVGQIIITTSLPAKETDLYGVGPISSLHQRTLNFDD